MFRKKSNIKWNDIGSVPRFLRENVNDDNLVSSEPESKACLLDIGVPDTKPDGESSAFIFFPKGHWEHCNL